ncbi:MAG TPA: hypothetical protein QGG59_05530 [Planctomycetota bacterium]|jgi:hypothetical protein|nr:hypothetical protein [Planctomycetota bacterium]MDP7245204.1 hypothetical protein [Planctomycetota bacterium]HJM39558.1 hypothetical protein [Planctomycetota bacterium]|tara:strand:+ start:45886 stop:46110 length:225 start_codon:yes stop_codon:yes gene_type:complete
MVRRAEDNEIDVIELIKQLQEARFQPSVRLVFKDGREFDGAITYQERFGTGRLINIQTEFSTEYNVYDLKEVIY